MTGTGGQAPGIRAVLWDADGVLQRVPAGWVESMRPAVEGHVADVDGFLAAAFWEERPALTGRARWLDLLPGLLEQWGIGHTYDDVVRIWLTIEPVEESRAVVRRLREAGLGCYLASNQDEHRAAYMQRELGYPDLLDGTFYSCDLGEAKPDETYFAAVLTRLGLPAAEVLFVDDSQRNVDAARAFGMVAEQWSYDASARDLEASLSGHGLPV